MFSSLLSLFETMTHIDSYSLYTVLDFACGSFSMFVKPINYNLSHVSLDTMNNMQILGKCRASDFPKSKFKKAELHEGHR